jgi:hypothetical protein
MIIDEKKVASAALSDERELHIPDDAPPDYNQVVASAPVTPADASGASSHRPVSLRQTTSTPAHVQNAVAGPSRLPPSNTASPSTPSSSWFSFTRSSKASSEIRSTVQSLIAELVRAPYADASPGILDSCASACKDAGLSVSEVLQQPNLEGHTALYWAIVKFAGRIGSADAAPEGARTLVLALLAHTTPLTQATLSEIRGAYAAVSDNALYQLCRPYLTPVQGTDRMLLTSNDPEGNDGKALQPEEVVVEESTEAPNAFSATFEIRMFQKRIRVGGYVSCEFVARGNYLCLPLYLSFLILSVQVEYSFLRLKLLATTPLVSVADVIITQLHQVHGSLVYRYLSIRHQRPSTRVLSSKTKHLKRQLLSQNFVPQLISGLKAIMIPLVRQDTAAVAMERMSGPNWRIVRWQQVCSLSTFSEFLNFDHLY